MTDDDRCVANPLADGARYHYDISVRPADQRARDEEFASVSSGGAGTRWMIADNLREAAVLLDIGRPSDATPLVAAPKVDGDDPRVAILDEAIGYALDNDGERTPSARLLLARLDAAAARSK